MKNRLVSECLKAFTKRQRRILYALMALTVLLGLIFPLLLSSDPRSVMTLSRAYRPGELSDEDVIAPSDFSYIDDAATADDTAEAARSVLPQFYYSISDSMEIRSRTQKFTEAISKGQTADFILANGIVDPERVAARLDEIPAEDKAVIASLVSESIIYLLNEGVFSAEDLEEIRNSGYQTLMVETSELSFRYSGRMRVLDSVIVIGEVYEAIFLRASQMYPELPSSYAALIADAVSLVISANVFYDPVLTTSMRESKAAAVPPVLVEIHRGDYIIQKDTVVTEQQLRTIQRFLDSAVVSISLQKALGYLIFLILVVVILVYLLFYFIKYRYRLSLYSTIFFVGIDLTLVASFFLSRFLPEEGVQYIDPFLPFILLPALATSITGRRRVGFSVALVLSAFASIYPQSRFFSFFYFLAVIECCLMFIRFGSERLDIIYQTLFSSIAVAGVTVLVSFIYDLEFQIVFTSAIAAAINVVLSFILLSILLPIIEKIFNIPTAYRLHELSFTDTPTLNRLSQVAPGTFNHAKNVSEMAYDACKAINANADLARVGGLYHDIGKAEHPEYFIENQNGKNAHDEINKTLSAAIIKSHVKLGVEKAKEIGLPQEVVDIIAEHHGNDLIKYFYNEAVREAKDSRSSMVSEEDFRYNGHIPSTVESAVVMLADCTEAATRTMKNPNHQKYDKFITNIFIDKMNYRQLNNSQLTINDLDKIRESFIHYLLGRDHQRIEYEKD